MKTIIDFTSFNFLRKDGLNRYIATFLLKLNNIESNDLTILSSPDILSFKIPQNINIQITKELFKQPNFWAVLGRYFFQNFYLPLKYKNTIYYSPLPEAPLFGKMKKIITVHDILPTRFPNTFPKAQYHFKVYLKLLLPKIDKIITVSNFTKEQIINYYNIKEINKIKTIYQGYNDLVFYPRTKEEFNKIKTKYNINSPYILSVGETRDYKNFHFLLTAFAKANVKDLKLIIVGKKNRLDKKTDEIIEKYKLHNKIILTDYISDDDLAILYSYASAFIFPSKYEGFGIPVLESLACDSPILLSNIPPFKEIIPYNKYSHLFFDPTKEGELIDKINNIFNYNFKISQEDKNKILQKFNWNNTIKNIFSVINEIK